ncbi:transcriptional regulator SlyA [Halomonas caseinilytica]|uniref:MarR family transcriptional regulator, transcriptional regulator for hemolysin n=1 Tax=Halomonas caseinilytica TaxID=438744 RepID=A0A1M7AIE7_9GAMM|nr:transcriptional regulator SlyA [Halomonas caseinilytica]SEN60508.1 MarR family transcriptional regulator, transcriptional regulator for hemolysin [Halomonas caseinilytica]SHL42375.1 MarR family transcriptional regulator, transcriptional regulator for hemolysin [Halomonas caseinilytica]
MHQNIGFQLARVPRLWRAVIDRRLAPDGLTQTRWVTLYHLWKMGDDQPQCDLARAIGVEAPSLVRTLDQLSEQGLIERRPCGQDRRAKRIFLTDKATPLLERIESVVTQARKEMLEGLDEAEVEHLIDLLSRIEANGLAIQEREEG